MAIKKSVPREHPLPYSQGLSKPSDSNVICSLSRRAGTTGPLSLCQKNLVDPASSHMLVSKIKPCMSQYEPLHGEIAYGSLKHMRGVMLVAASTWSGPRCIQALGGVPRSVFDGVCLPTNG